MDKPQRAKAPFNSGGFVSAALLAPSVAATIFILGAALTEFSIEPREIATLVGSVLFALLIVGIWGAVPSLVFGGLVLAVIQRMPWRKRPNAAVFVIGGVVAAGLYVLAGLGVAGPLPGAAMFFAPWAMREMWGPTPTGEDWWMVASLLLAGAVAGLIYSALAKRG